MDEKLPLWQRLARTKASYALAVIGFADMVMSVSTGVNGIIIHSILDFIFK